MVAPVTLALVVAGPSQLQMLPMLELATSPHPTVELEALAKSPRMESAVASPTMVAATVVAARAQLRTVMLMTLATSPHPMGETEMAATVVMAVMKALATSAHPLMESAVA